MLVWGGSFRRYGRDRIRRVQGPRRFVWEEENGKLVWGLTGVSWGYKTPSFFFLRVSEGKIENLKKLWV